MHASTINSAANDDKLARALLFVMESIAESKYEQFMSTVLAAALAPIAATNALDTDALMLTGCGLFAMDSFKICAIPAVQLAAAGIMRAHW